jgi:hypothetical protein
VREANQAGWVELPTALRPELCLYSNLNWYIRNVSPKLRWTPEDRARDTFR